jgi:hypothetical protein
MMKIDHSSSGTEPRTKESGQCPIRMGAPTAALSIRGSVLAVTPHLSCRRIGMRIF